MKTKKVVLSAEDRRKLNEIIKEGVNNSYKKRALILLDLDKNFINIQGISILHKVSVKTIRRIICKYNDIGVDCIYNKK